MRLEFSAQIAAVTIQLAEIRTLFRKSGKNFTEMRLRRVAMSNHESKSTGVDKAQLRYEKKSTGVDRSRIAQSLEGIGE